MLDLLHDPAPTRVTTCTATAPEAVRTLRTNRETIPEGFHDRLLVTTSGPGKHQNS